MNEWMSTGLITCGYNTIVYVDYVNQPTLFSLHNQSPFTTTPNLHNLNPAIPSITTHGAVRRNMAASGPGEFFRRNDAYRNHPLLKNQLKNALPGFGLAVTAFAVYLFADGMSKKLAAKEPGH